MVRTERRCVLVTGGAGYIGSHFVAALTDAGLEYVVLDDLSRGHATAVPSDRLVVGSIGDAALVENLCRDRGVDSVVHFAAFAYVGESVRDPELYYRNNVAANVALFGALRAAGVRRIVFSSSCATYGVPPEAGAIVESTPQSPINPYGRTKLMTEQMLRDYAAAYHWGYAALRYFNAAGSSEKHVLPERHDPETHLIPLAIAAASGGAPLTIFGDDYPTPDGTCVRDYVHVDDLASAHLAALERLRAERCALELNLGTGKGASIRSVIAAVERQTGGVVAHTVGPRRPGDPPYLVADARAAKAVLDWSPRYVELDNIVRSACAALGPAAAGRIA